MDYEFQKYRSDISSESYDSEAFEKWVHSDYDSEEESDFIAPQDLSFEFENDDNKEEI
jgi:hypothetical protein